jgi:predicted phage-related endonuclease
MLTAAQLEARKGKLTASRVACLMRGKADDIMRLWLEMTGQQQEEDLSHVWQVRFGENNEQLNLDWFEEKNRVPVIRRGEVVIHPWHDCFACTLDGWIDVPGCPIEAKCTGGHEPLEVIIERYQPQMQWQMACTESTKCALTVIKGGAEPVVDYIDIDPVYGNELERRALQFMESVRSGVPPVILPPVPPPVDRFIDYNMAGNDTWHRYAAQWLQTRGAVDSCREAEKVLKSLVPEDARKCFAEGVQITRDRVGRLSLRVAA